MCDRNIYTGATLAPFQATERPYGMIANGAVFVSEGVTAWSRTAADIPSTYSAFPTRDLQGRPVTAGAARGAYACRLWRQSRRRGRKAPERCRVRGDRQYRGRHRLDRFGHTGRVWRGFITGALRPVCLKATYPGARMGSAENVACTDGYIAEACIPAFHAAFAGCTLCGTQSPPIYLLRDHQAPIALTTDGNPGSSPLTSTLLAVNMGCTLFRITPKEALAGTIRHATKALGLTDTGVIAPSMRADLANWDVQHPAERSYRTGVHPVHKRIFGGHS